MKICISSQKSSVLPLVKGHINIGVTLLLAIPLSIITGACSGKDSSVDAIKEPNAGTLAAGAGGLVGGTSGQATGPAGKGGSSGAGSGGTKASAGRGGSSGKGGLGGSTTAGAGGKAGSGGTAPTGCGKNGGKYRGKSSQTLTAADTSRTFILYESPKLDAQKPAPLVIVPHGYSMSGEAMYTITRYNEVADREGLVVAYPDGQGLAPWYVGEGTCTGMGDVGKAGAVDIDQTFINEIIKFVDADQCVDRDHIYITGFSMGGFFSNETACVNTAFRAAGPHSGGSHDLSACANKHKPVIIFHFKNDALIDYGCGTEARDRWVEHNGCSPTSPEVVTVKGGSCEYYQGCPADGQVAMCSFNESETGVGELLTGHAWSGGTADSFGIPQTESATELGWAFFKKYAW